MKPLQGLRCVRWKFWVPNQPSVSLWGENRVVSWAQIPPGGQAVIAQVSARMGLNLQELKVSNNLDQLVQNNHTCSGEPHFPPHSTPLVETYSSKENLSLRLQFSDTWTQHTISGRIFSTLGKKGIKQSFLKLHQPAQLPSSHSLPYKAFPALYHIPYSTKCFLSYFTLLKGLRSWILQCDL